MQQISKYSEFHSWQSSKTVTGASYIFVPVVIMSNNICTLFSLMRKLDFIN